jgi:hypothetical protein
VHIIICTSTTVCTGQRINTDASGGSNEAASSFCCHSSKQIACKIKMTPNASSSQKDDDDINNNIDRRS